MWISLLQNPLRTALSSGFVSIWSMLVGPKDAGWLPAAGFDRLAPAEGAFYLYADVSHLTNDSETFCREMLDQTGVATAPGIDFDQARGRAHLRISYAGPTAEIEAAIARLADWRRRG